MHKTAILLQARSTSTRLPAKVHLQLPRVKRNVIEEIVQRLERVDKNIPVIVVIPDSDSLLKDICKQHRWTFFCGHQDDVRQRYRQAAEYYKLEYIIRACCDSPCLDWYIVRESWQHFHSLECDLFFFRGLPPGLQAECFSVKALKTTSNKEADPKLKKNYQEHVSLHIKENPQQFCVKNQTHALAQRWQNIIQNNKSLICPSFTLDTLSDYQRIAKIFHKLPANFRNEHLLKYWQQESL